MAPKKAPSKDMPLPAPSHTSCSKAEEEPEKQAKPSQAPYKPSGPVSKAPSTKGGPQQLRKAVAASSDSDSGSESESESESEGDGASSSSTKRMPAAATSPSKKAKSGELAPPAVSKEKNNETERKRFERFWSLEDEMEILKLLVAFKKEHGHEPARSVDVDILYKTAKSSFTVDFTRSQLGNKITNLKRRFVNLLEKGQLPKKVADANAAFDLAKEIWGERNKNKGIIIDLEMKGALKKGGKNSKAIIPTEKPTERTSIPLGKSKSDDVIDFVAKEFNLLDRNFLKKRFARLDPEEWKAIEKVQKRLNLREMEFQVQRLKAAQQIIQVLKDKMDS